MTGTITIGTLTAGVPRTNWARGNNTELVTRGYPLMETGQVILTIVLALIASTPGAVAAIIGVLTYRKQSVVVTSLNEATTSSQDAAASSYEAAASSQQAATSSRAAADSSKAAASSAARCEMETTQVNRKLNGGVEAAIESAIKPVREKLDEHARLDEKNVAELSKYIHDTKHELANALGTIANKVNVLVLKATQGEGDGI